MAGLANSTADDALSKVKSSLAWQAKLRPEDLSARLNMEHSKINEALQVLGTRGLVGYDLAQGAYFHRELPFDLSLVEELHPRMKKARQIYDEKNVRLVRNGADAYEAYVKGSKGDHYVQVTEDSFRCTCDWFATNQGDRGPCSHVLAAEIASQSEDGNSTRAS